MPASIQLATQRFLPKLSLLFLSSTLLLVGCGGGHSDASAPAPNEQTVATNAVVSQPAVLTATGKTYLIETVNVPNLNLPTSLAMGKNGFIYLADTKNHAIQKISITGSPMIVDTFGGQEGFADGSTNSAQFRYPFGVAVNSKGQVFVADSANHQIRVISPDGQVTSYSTSTTAGYQDGPLASAMFADPYGLAFDKNDNLYVADIGNHRIRKISPDLIVTTVAGTGERGLTNGAGHTATFNEPSEVVVDDLGNIYVADTKNHTIRKITPDGVVSTYAGTGKRGFVNGSRLQAQFFDPRGLAMDSLGNLYIADTNNLVIRKITSDQQVSTFAGAPQEWTGPDFVLMSTEGTTVTAHLAGPWGLAFDRQDNLFFTEVASNKLRKVVVSANP